MNSETTIQDPVAEEPPVIKEKKSNIPEETLQDMQKLWRVFDLKKLNKVDISQLKRIMSALDFHLDPKELALVRKQVDPDTTGFMTFESLRLVMEDKLKEVDTYEDLILQFKKLDKDGDGMIPAPEYKQYMKNLGVKLTEEQVEAMMSEADAKGDGIVEMESFGQKICPTKDD